MLDDTIAARRFNTILVTIFALVAVVLAAVGLYGLLAYMVGQQRREIGVRMALGASTAGIVRAVAARAVAAACAGGALGVVLSVGLSRAIAQMLYGVGAFDPISYAGAAIVLAAVVTTAAIVPLKRALAVDPAVSLRAE
jgi:ABC-type antimicrobial peptide transport system permease subunit